MIHLKQIVRRSGDEILMAVMLVLSTSAAAAVVADPLLNQTQQQTAGQFQRLMGGLGLGCHADLAHCAWQFDPRLMGDEDAPLNVVAGSHVSNPWHALSLFPASAEFGDAPEQE